MSKNRKKERDLNVELIRIISMLLIVAHHYSVYCASVTPPYFRFENLFYDFLKAGGKFGIILFVLITGYYAVDSVYKRRKIIRTVFHTEFYSCLFFLLALIFKQPFSVKIIGCSILPILFNSYWFISSYVVLYLLIPYLNRLIQNLTKQEYSYLLLLLFGFTVFFPTFTFTNFSFGDIGLLIFIYLIGSYIKIYHEQFRKKHHLLKGIGFFLLAYIMTIFIQFLSLKVEFLNTAKYHFLSLNSIFLYGSAIHLFLYFTGLKVSKGKNLILFFSTTTLGVYLIHENYFARNFIWKYLFVIEKFTKGYLVIHAITSIIFTYVVCSVIDYFYLNIIEKHILPFIEKLYIKIWRKIHSILQGG